MDRGKAPSYQWYPGDWQRDTSVRVCSLAARGLWREMLDLMHDGDPRGTMQVGRKVIGTAAEIAAMVGAKPGEDVPALLAELEDAGVFSRTEAGTIYSRRMVRDTHISEVRRAAGSEGGRVAQAKLRGNGEQPPAVAEAEKQSAEEELPEILRTDAFRAAWADWYAYRRERNLGKWSARTVAIKLAQFAKWGEAATVQAIRESIGNGWQGIFPPKSGGPAVGAARWTDPAVLKAGGTPEAVAPLSTSSRLVNLASALPSDLPGANRWRLEIGSLTGTTEEIEHALGEMDGRLLAALRSHAGDAALGEIRAQVRGTERSLAKHIPEPELAAWRQRAEDNLLRHRYGAPALSLFGDEARKAAA